MTPSLTYSYPSAQPRAELLSPVDDLSYLKKLENHPQPGKHRRKGKEKSKQREGYYRNKDQTSTGIWKHGLGSHDLVAWGGYDGPTGYIDEEYDNLYLYSAIMAQTETDHP